MWTRVPTRNAVQTGPHAVETISLLGGTHENVNVGPSRRSRVTGTDDVAPLTSVSHTSRSRLIGFTAGVVFALFAIAGVAATHDGVRDVAFTKMAALGRGRSPAVSSRAESHEDWLLGDFSEQPRGEPKLGAFPRKAGGKGSGSTLSGAREGFAQRDGSSRDGSSVASRSKSSPNSSRGLRNAEGGVPGLVRHVDGVTTTTRFRMISFCNQAYWPFAHGMLQSMQVNAPTLVPFWTIMVADEDTKKFIHKNAPNIDVFVDVDLQTLVSDAEDADLGELKKLLSWRRMHALYGLVNADYTTVFLEPDVVFTKNPLQLFHDMLLDADIVASSDFGFGHAAVSRVNTKVLFAKPSDEAKKLLDVWQRAEAAYRGEDSEKGFLVTQILPNAGRMEAAIHVLDQNTVGNYLSHSSESTPTIITGTGCDDVNYKLNWMKQIVLTVLPAGPEGKPPIDYDAVQDGCDFQTRLEATKSLRNLEGNGGADGRGGLRALGGDEEGEETGAPRRRQKQTKRARRVVSFGE